MSSPIKTSVILWINLYSYSFRKRVLSPHTFLPQVMTFSFLVSSCFALLFFLHQPGANRLSLCSQVSCQAVVLVPSLQQVWRGWTLTQGPRYGWRFGCRAQGERSRRVEVEKTSSGDRQQSHGVRGHAASILHPQVTEARMTVDVTIHSTTGCFK